MNTNLQLALDRLTGNLEGRPALLLHSCCAPCSSYVLEYLSRYFDITLFFHNPNIGPEEEYLRRLEEQRRLIKELPLSGRVELLVGEYDPKSFLRAVEGLEREPEGGKRCEVCFRMRLGETARRAAAEAFDYAATTLSISPHKDAALLDRILRDCCEELPVLPLPSDFKKKGGYQRSLLLSKEHGLYRQDYCGCVFSKRPRF